MNRVLQPRPLVVLGLNVWMGTDAGEPVLDSCPEGCVLDRKSPPEPKTCPPGGRNLGRACLRTEQVATNHASLVFFLDEGACILPYRDISPTSKRRHPRTTIGS